MRYKDESDTSAEIDVEVFPAAPAPSIPANVAEGCGRGTDNELVRYVRIGLGSATELEYHLILARDLGILPLPAYESLNAAILEVQSMLGWTKSQGQAGPQA